MNMDELYKNATPAQREAAESAAFRAIQKATAEVKLDQNIAQADIDAGNAYIYEAKVRAFEQSLIGSFAAAALGRKGGQSTSDAKRAASRANGKKGGRPRKSTE